MDMRVLIYDCCEGVNEGNNKEARKRPVKLWTNKQKGYDWKCLSTAIWIPFHAQGWKTCWPRVLSTRPLRNNKSEKGHYLPHSTVDCLIISYHRRHPGTWNAPKTVIVGPAESKTFLPNHAHSNKPRNVYLCLHKAKTSVFVSNELTVKRQILSSAETTSPVACVPVSSLSPFPYAVNKLDF